MTSSGYGNLPLTTLRTLHSCSNVNLQSEKWKTISSHSSRSNPKWVLPIRALLGRLHHILANTLNPSTIISTYFQTPSCKDRLILANDINKGVKSELTLLLSLVNNGLHQDLVGSHSLKAGAAMAMYLQGIDPNTIKKMERWSSDTFLMYIHEQMSAISTGVSHKMSTNICFHNIAFQLAAPLPSIKRHGQLKLS